MTEKLRKRLYLNEGWLFTTAPQKEMAFDAYQLTKAGASVSPAARSYDDHDWETVRLPHDYAVIQDLDAGEDNYNGYLSRKNCWYRRYFYLPENLDGKRLMLHFGGVSGKSEIYLNGCLLKRSDSSFCDLCVDISDYACVGTDVNVLAVRLVHDVPEGWWYQGCGLYREAWIDVSPAMGFEEQGLHIVTEKKGRDTWTVTAEGSLYTLGSSESDLSAMGRIVGTSASKKFEEPVTVSSATVEKDGSFVLQFEVENPRLWDIGAGNLYTLQLELVKKNGSAGLEEKGTEKESGEPGDSHEVLDLIRQTFGFREFVFDPDRGLILNGVRREIRGLCFHEDEGNLGWAIDRSVYERRIQNLVKMGGNAYRCSHNAPDPVVLELCDRYGILVMDETRRFDSGEIGMRELAHLIRRDRNHPCIILWSMGNEETIQGTIQGARIMRRMKKLVYQLDGTRPVTLAMHQNFGLEGAAGEADVIGVNYNHEILDEIRALYPDKPFVGSEVLNLADRIVEAGNIVSGSIGAAETLQYAETHPFYSGTFGWAGEEYRGEHRNLAFFTDACPISCNGAPKDGYYQYQARWGTEPVLHICGHWNPDTYVKEGTQEIRRVEVFTNLASVRMYRNGELIGEEKEIRNHTAVFLVPYEPGKLVAEGYNDSQELVLREEKKTSSLAHHLVIEPEKETCPADGRSHMTFRIEMRDEQDVKVPMAAHIFRVTCEGDAQVICTDSEDPYCSCFPDPCEMGLYKGRGMAVLRAGHTAGDVTVTVSSDGILPASCRVKMTAPVSLGNEAELLGTGLAEADAPFINDWFVSRVYSERPDIYEYTTDDNYSFWRKSLERATMVEQGLPFFYQRGGGGYVIYCMEPNMPALKDGQTGKVVFEEITGSCQILISMRDYNNRILKRFYREDDREEPRRITMELPDIETGDRLILKVLVRGSHSKCGVTGPVRFA